MSRHSRPLFAAISALLIAALAGCQPSPDGQQTGTPENNTSEARAPDTILVAGSSFAAPLFETWRKDYSAKHPGIDIRYDAIGSGEGIERFLSGETDIGTTDAPITPEQSSSENASPEQASPHANSADRDFVQIPITAGMIALVYNLPGVEGPLRLPRDLYPEIFLGKVARWDDPRIVAANPDLDLPAKLIQLVARQDASGTTFAFTSHLSAINNAWGGQFGAAKVIDWPGGTMTARGNEGVAQRIKITAGSLGYVGAGFAQQLSLPAVELENRAGEFVAPNTKSGQAAMRREEQPLPEDLTILIADPEARDAYPIVTHTWALIRTQYADHDKARAIRAFIDWAVTDGQQEAEALGYLPLAPDIAEAAREALHDSD